MKNSLKQLINIVTCAAVLAASGPIAKASAHDVDEPPKKARLNNFEELYFLQNERNSIHKGGPIAGIALSSVFAVAGAAWLGTSATTLSWENGWDDDYCYDEYYCYEDDRRGGPIAGVAIGSVMLVSSVVGLAVSIKNLRVKKEKAAELDRRIQQLQFESMRVSVSDGPMQKPAMIRF